jgi:L-cysteine S-thiosulfotransferase
LSGSETRGDRACGPVSRSPASSERGTRGRHRLVVGRRRASLAATLAAGGVLLATSAITAAQPVATEARALRSYTVVGDAIPEPLSDAPGDAARGRAIVVNRQLGLCLLCHAGPFPEERFQGTLAPDLAGAGARWSAAQLRLRLVDAHRLNPATIMPAYYRTDGLSRVAAAWRSRPLLDAQQVEDVVALLSSLRN